MSFQQEANAAQIAWKATSASLPDAARAPGKYRGRFYDFCLPREFATCNLLAEAQAAVAYFAAAGIAWHDGVEGGPANHLRDSQVQCVNAFAPFAHAPELLAAAFGATLGIATPRPMLDPADPEAYVAFEWIGDGNPLGEWTSEAGIRGAKNTSADAAIRYVDQHGREVLTLIEWKYTERYLGEHAELHTSSTSKATRDARYRHLYDAPDGPLVQELVPYDDFYVEPVYQLLRLSLLAWQLEQAGAAEMVRVLYCAPARNAELWTSLNRASHRAACGDGDLRDLWRLLQRRPDRFEIFDTAQLVSANAPTSTEFRARYGHMAGTQ